MKKLKRVIKIKEILQKEFCSQTLLKNSRRSKSIVNKNKNQNVLNLNIISNNYKNINNTQKNNKETKKHNNNTNFHNIDQYNNNIINIKYDAISKLTKTLIDQGS